MVLLPNTNLYDGKSPSCFNCYKELPYRLGKYLTNFWYPARTSLMTKQNGASDLLKRCTAQRDRTQFYGEPVAK
jgi:hypothetical protein